MALSKEVSGYTSCWLLLKEIALPLSKEIAGYETKNQATKVDLPGYIGEEREDNETSDYG